MRGTSPNFDADGRDVEMEHEAARIAVTPTAISIPGHFGRTRRKPRMMAMAIAGQGDGRGIERAEASPDRPELGQQGGGLVSDIEAKQLLAAGSRR